MNKLLFFVTLFLLSSCSPETKGGNKSVRNGDYNIKVIDSCEYIEYDSGIFDQRVYGLCHKGNCKFCQKRK